MRALYLILAFVGAGFLLAIWWTLDKLEQPITYLMWALVAGVGVFVLYLAGRGLLRIIDGLVDVVHHYQLNKHERTEARRNSKLQIVTAAAGEQVYIVSNDEYHHNIRVSPAHLAPGAFNGQAQAFTDSELKRWAFDKAVSARQPKAVTDQASPVVEELTPIMPLCLKAQRLLIGGGSDSGKTTLAKHIISARPDDEILIPIDPHGPSKLFGVDVIGAGRDWEGIRDALDSLVFILGERYDDIKLGTHTYGEHTKMTAYIDELTAILDPEINGGKIPNAKAQIKQLLVESRKVNITMIMMIHGLDTSTLGLSAGIRSSAKMVWLEGGNNGEPHRGFVLPNNGKITARKDWKEHALPGPFTGYPQPAGELVLSLPEPEQLQIENLIRQGFKNYSICKAIGVSANTKQYDRLNAIREQLGLTEASQ